MFTWYYIKSKISIIYWISTLFIFEKKKNFNFFLQILKSIITFLIVGVLTTAIILESFCFLHKAICINGSLDPNKSLLKSLA
jgi:hypothetical protein